MPDPDLLTRVETIERHLSQRNFGAWLVYRDTDLEADLAFLCAEVRRQQGIIAKVEAVLEADPNQLIREYVNSPEKLRLTEDVAAWDYHDAGWALGLIRRALSSAEAT